MNRIITILVTIFILLLLYIWISHVWGSDKPRHPQQIVDATQSEQTLGADDPSADIDTFLNTSPDLVSTETENKEEEKEDETSVSNTQETVAPPKNEPVKKEVVEEKKPEVKKTENIKKPVSSPVAPVTKPAEPVAKKTSMPASAEGKHLVIAGNFLQRENADQRMQELKKAGFKDVEVVNFDLSEYHTVCAGRFTDVNEARRLVKKLKDYHKIDAYVRVGN